MFFPLIKGLDSSSEGISLISKLIEEQLSIPCHVLMGANLAAEVAQEMFVEATIGKSISFSLPKTKHILLVYCMDLMDLMTK